ncbi:MAG: DUF2726 domain-containing protein [Pseudomonadota bacterium]|nr:DUF2726 domain-containing protein [Pseudomonadota bacterium]
MSTSFFLVVIVVSLAVLALLKSPTGPTSFTYRRKPCLLSKAERSFYGVLTQAVAGKALIFSKVRVADVITPQQGLTRSNWQRAFNKISAKHVDFLLCDPQDCAVKLAIELDDASHGSAKRQKRDAFLEQACESAGLPLLRIRAARGYGVADIRQRVEAVLFPVQHDSSLEKPEQVEGQGVEVTVSEQERADNQTERQAGKPIDSPTGVEVAAQPAAPACHQCGEVMVLRQAQSGKYAGQQFWGCSAFPKCRGAMKC